MKVLYASCDNGRDPNLWSGLVWHMRLALERAGFEVELFDRIPFECPFLLRLLHQFHKRLGKRVHQIQCEPAVLRRAARRIEARFRETASDAVFCPGVGVPVNAFIDPEIPVFTYLDATKQSWIDTYCGLGTLCERSQRIVPFVDQYALNHNTLTIFASDWAAQAAMRETGCPANRVAVVPFGANITDPPSGDEVEAFIAARAPSKCRLLFLGKEWKRKGGREALETVRGLRAVGISAELDIIGCTPEIPTELQESVRVHGFVDRATPEGSGMFRRIASQAHYLLFFSEAEAYGLALCEANAFGVPCLASSVGGIPTIIRDGVNGFMFPNPIDPARVVERILMLMGNAEAYHRLARSARAEFDVRLNWNTAGKHLRQLIESRIFKY